ncbi:DUF2299 family protein [bacterium]|nr:DUF2299 family protein [bacterium]
MVLIGGRIAACLESEQWEVDKGRIGGHAFYIVARKPNAPSIVVAPSREISERIELVVPLRLAPDSEKRFQSLGRERRNECLWSIRLGLLQMDVEFKGVEEPLEQITVHGYDFLDQLARGAFTLRLNHIHKGGLFVAWSLMRALEVAPSEIGFGKSLGVEGIGCVDVTLPLPGGCQATPVMWV